MNNALNNDSESTIKEIVDEAALAPKALIEASLGKSENSIRPKGLILTKSQIIDLYRYEQKGLVLPTTLESVSVYLGYGQDVVPGFGLKVQDFTNTFTLIKNHASKWNGIRQRIKGVSTELKLFATTIGNVSKHMDATLSQITTLDKVKELGIVTVEDLKRVEQEMGDKFPGFELNPDEAEAAKSIGYLLEQLLTDIKQKASLTDLLKEDLENFADELATKVRPEVALRLTAIRNNDFKDDVIRLQEQIESLNAEIDEKNKAYKAMVNDSLQSASKLNILGLAMAIYFGVEAENVRKERNELKNARDAKNEEMGSKNRILQRLNEVRADMQELEFLTLQADAATRNLVTVWNALHRYVTTSEEASAKITDALAVQFLAYHFDQVVEPWAFILKEADELHAVFAEAEAEIKTMSL